MGGSATATAATATATDTNGDRPTELVARPPKFALVSRALEKGKDGKVHFTDLNGLLDVASWSDHSDKPFRDQHAAYYTDVENAFKESDEGCQVWVFANIRAAVHLTGDRKRLEIKVEPQRIHFDWTDASQVLYATEALQEDVHLWLRYSHDGPALMQRLAALASRVMGLISAEAGGHPANTKRKPSPEFQANIRKAEEDLEIIEEELDAAAQRAALVMYARGMARGIAIIVLVAIGIAVAFYYLDVRFDQEIALITGALGAVVSVMQRMSAGKLKIDYRTAGDMVRTFGVVRPLLGAVFGMVVFALIEGGFLPWVDAPQEPGAYAAFLAILGFLSGFNERFAQDMLGRAGEALQPPPTGAAPVV